HSHVVGSLASGRGERRLDLTLQVPQATAQGRLDVGPHALQRRTDDPLSDLGPVTASTTGVEAGLGAVRLGQAGLGAKVPLGRTQGGGKRVLVTGEPAAELMDCLL